MIPFNLLFTSKVSRFHIVTILLITLFAADTILTFLAIEYLGATEMNPLFYQLGGLYIFTAFKILISIVAIVVIMLIERTQSKIATILSICICGLYSGVLIWNIIELLSHFTNIYLIGL